VPTPLDVDLALLEATAMRHARTLPPHTSVHLSAAIDALTEPLTPPPLATVDPADTADPASAMQAVRMHLQSRGQPAGLRQTVAVAMAVRKLSEALSSMSPGSGHAEPAGRVTDVERDLGPGRVGQ